MTGGVIDIVETDSLAARLGLCPGDVLLEINGHPLRDVLDVQYYAADESLELLIQRGGDKQVYQAEREYGIPLGLGFSSPTFDGIRRCQNRCEFCFVAQMPAPSAGRGRLPGNRPLPAEGAGRARLRSSLYVRDDDYRYSVLYGSFITLTHLTGEDWVRLEEQRLSPLYVSVHATEPTVRQRLLGREDIPDILPQIDRLAALGIELHTQVVLTPGVNDDSHLFRTIADLVDRYPHVQSIGVVPVGLTRYHRGGCRLYTSQEAQTIVEQLAPLQTKYRALHGVSLVYLADEWYLLAGQDVPADEMYDDYAQIENGIGLVRQFLENSSRVQGIGCRLKVASCTLACGTLVAPVMQQVAGELARRSGCRIEVIPVVNGLFGETVTVSGLLGGEDVLAALQGRERGEMVFLPRAMFAQPPAGDGTKGGGLRTLDDLTIKHLQEQLGCSVVLADKVSEVAERIFGAG